MEKHANASDGNGIILLQKIRLDDKEAFELLFRRYYHRLCGFANKFLNDLDESEEIVQEVFFRIWQNREKLQLGIDIQPYMFRSVQNVCLNFLKHKKVANQYSELLQLLYKEGSECDYSGYENMIVRELEININKAIDGLPDECRKIFLLNRNEGFKYAEIAEQLGISVKTVETQMSRALKKLREELKDYLILFIFTILMLP
jgi:RNA polymerase sigma-70 factor, ECF subfamily